MPEGMFTWESLLTLTGASALTYFIVAYTKTLVDRFWKFGTDLYAVFVGFIVLFCSTTATGYPFTWSSVMLSFFNGFIVAAAAGKMNDKAITERDKKDQMGAF